MKRLATAVTVLVILIPLHGAIAGSGDSSGTEVAFYDPGSSQWTVPGGSNFYYGAPGDTPLMCDWNGDGVATVGVYRESTGYLLLHDGNATGSASYEFYYGIPGDRPVCGDWNGDGIDTIAIFRPSEQRFYLRNVNSQGFGQKEFQFGFQNGIPFAGDFNGDGIDTVGVRDPKNGFLALARGHVSDSPVMEAYFGSSGDTLVVGDWDGDGTDRIAVFQPATNTLAVTNLFGSTKIAAVYDLGTVGGIPLAAEFNPAGGTHTTHPEWNGEVGPIVRPPQPPAEEEPPVEESPPVAVAPPVSGDWYGTGVKGHHIRPRNAYDTDYAIGPVTAPRSGNLTRFATYFIFANENYYRGTGGINRFSIRPDDNGQPGGTVLGEFTISNPFSSGGIWSGDGSGDDFSYYGFDSPVPITAGSRYWVVVENLHPDPTNNWVGIDSITSADGAPGSVFVHLETSPGTNTFERFSYPGEGWFLALFDLQYQEGDGFGQGFYHAKFEQNIGGGAQAREVFTPTTNHTVTGARVWAERTSGDGALTATLTSGGTTITQASVSGSGWLAYPINTTLSAGTTYTLEFSAPAGTTYQFIALRENQGWSAGSYFSDGYADYNGGAGWSGGWPMWGSTRQTADLQFYFTK